MVEEIIKRCLDDGSFSKYNDGVVYNLKDAPNVYCINATVRDPIGIHARAATALVKKAKEWNMDTYIIDLDKKAMSNASGILNVLYMTLETGRHVAIAANHEADEEKIKALYDIITNVYD